MIKVSVPSFYPFYTGSSLFHILSSERRRRTPLQADGASETSQHKDSLLGSDSIPKLDTDALYPDARIVVLI